MATNEAGDPASFPEEVEVGSDGDPFTADLWAPGLEGLADRTAWLRSRLALSFPIKHTGPTGATNNGAFYVPFLQRWYVLGDGEDVRESGDAALSWAVTTGIATAGAGEDVHNGDADASGNAVAATDTEFVFAFNAGTSAWTKVDVRSGAGAWATLGQVVHDPINAKWIWISSDAGDGYLLTSADRATWATPGSAIVPFGTWVATTMMLGVNKTSGRTILMGAGAALAISITMSDDGGDNWSALDTLVTTIGTPTNVWLSYNASEEAWYFVIANGSQDSEVWRSDDDGDTWTKKATLSSVALRTIAGFGPNLLMAVSGTGIPASPGNRVYASVDQGATWRRLTLACSGTVKGIYEGGGQPLIVTATTTYVGLDTSCTDLGAAT